MKYQHFKTFVENVGSGLLIRFGIVGTILACTTTIAHAGIVIYDNTTTTAITNINFNGARTVSGNLIANMDADDIVVGLNFAGYSITDIAFLAFNSNTIAVTARPTFFIWAANGASGNPGTFLAQFVLPVTTFAPQASTPLNVHDPSQSVVIPITGRFWAGVVFDNNNGTTGINATQLNRLGGQVFNPPTVGNSDGLVTVFHAPGSGPINVNNPTVIPFQLGNNNYGWRIEAQPVPEPSSLLLMVSGFAFALVYRRCRHQE